MGLFARSKRSSVGTCWASSRPLVYLLALALLATEASADTGVVSAVGYGRDASEAIVSLLRAAITKNFKDEPAVLTKAVLQNEIIPNASSFVQSYRILEGGKSGHVALSANLDLDILRALFALTPARLEAGENAKALVVVRGAKLPTNVPAAKGATAPADPFLVMEAAARERLARRQFEVVSLPAADLQATGSGDDPASPELLRGLASRAGARVAIGISARYEDFENENSHNKETRVVVSATLVDSRTGAVLGRSALSVGEPKGRRDQYVADLQRTLAEESKDLFQELLVAGGRKFARSSGAAGFSLVRVAYPSNAMLVAKFRALLEGAKGIRSVVEYGATRGALDFAVRPPMEAPALAKLVKGLASEEIVISTPEAATATEGSGVVPALVVQVAPKVAATGGAVNENP